ncbi:hypothetical protein [Streptomyces sp. URMC 123]|uniref:hypothetical protein n=1 Tax=Streptomyces sp. URMC 123 TaxID=3423403 RepID=UPI003F53A71E
MSTADLRRLQEKDDLKLYGNRYYTRDRQEWLRTLPPGEKWKEERRVSRRIKQGKMPWHDHRRILRAGKLPPDTSPADPRYLDAKRKVERKEDRREQHYFVAALVVMLALMVMAVLDGAVWLAVVLGALTVVALVSGHLKGRSSA